jgi:CPA1 family monovalent cation:H+ antiporter
MDPGSKVVQIVAGVTGLLFIASVAHALTRRLRIPFTVILVLAGIALSALATGFPKWAAALHGLDISPELILYVFLPPLIFESAFHMDARQLRENLGPVLTLAVPGLLLSTLLIGLIVALATPVPLAATLLLGAILSATDPVAVTAVFKRLGAPQRLRTLVEGESLFNDATSIVLARILLGVALAGGLTGPSAARGAVSFVLVFFGGLLAGWLVGILIGFALGKVEDNFVEITLTTVLAYLSFLLAEGVLHVSGVMAVMAAGLTIGGSGRARISPAVRAYLERFWEYVSFLANALIFLMIGLRVDLRELWSTAELACIVVLAMLLSRAVVVYGLMYVTRRLPPSRAVETAYRTVIFWGGLRGAISLALVLSLPHFEHGELFSAVVMGAVLFTLVVQGTTIEPLVRYLGLDRPPAAERLALLEADFTAYRRVLDRLTELLPAELFSGALATRMQAMFEEKLARVKAGIEELQNSELRDDDQQRSLLCLRALEEQKSIYVALFDKVQIGERAFRRLLAALDHQVDLVRDTGRCEALQPSSFRPSLLEKLASRAAGRWSLLAAAAERLQTDHLATEYQMAAASYLSSSRILNMLDALARLESTPWYISDQMRRQYRQRSDSARRQLDEMAERHPSIAARWQERSGMMLLLRARAESIAEQTEQGALAPAAADALREEITSELRQVRASQSGAPKGTTSSAE